MPQPENNESPRVIRKAALALFKNKKILMARDDHNDEAFYIPGGKIEDGETDIDCLVREIKEELASDIDVKSIVFLGEFEAEAHGKKDTNVNIRLFSAKLIDEPKPSSEIVELKYFDTSVDERHLTPVLIKKIFPWLKKHGYID